MHVCSHCRGLSSAALHCCRAAGRVFYLSLLIFFSIVNTLIDVWLSEIVSAFLWLGFLKCDVKTLLLSRYTEDCYQHEIKWVTVLFTWTCITVHTWRQNFKSNLVGSHREKNKKLKKTIKVMKCINNFNNKCVHINQ